MAKIEIAGAIGYERLPVRAQVLWRAVVEDLQYPYDVEYWYDDAEDYKMNRATILNGASMTYQAVISREGKEIGAWVWCWDIEEWCQRGGRV